MNGYAGTVVPPGGMYVRALYDYDADDRTSLSFRQGDIIQVITQLESGWWDGVINGVRGWFPSNYCAVVPRPAADDGHDDIATRLDEEDEDDADAEIKGEYDGDEYEDADSESNFRDDTELPLEGANGADGQHEAAFWIPQAMQDGRLFYFNTLTGQSTMELPLETPTSAAENGPRDRTNVFIPDSTRPPPELLAGGYEREDDTDYDNSASEAEGKMAGSRSSLKQRAFNGVSPATSIDSLNPNSPGSHTRAGFIDPTSQKPLLTQDTSMTSFTSGALGAQPTSMRSRKFFDDANPVPLKWNRLVEDMRRSVERYRQAINAGDKSDLVRRVEDISDHLRLIFAAGSGTTDNHSGNPSIISSNRSLYPHFRETMSRFSKLVLSSHIAATDWPPPDSYAKCLREAEGVLNGMYGFVEVARRQRGEEIPRLIPGFVANSYNGGSWQNNGVPVQDGAAGISFIDQDDYEPVIEPVKRLDSKVLERLEDYKRMVISALRKLDEQLVLRDKLITPLKHRAIGDTVCKAGKAVLDYYAPWIATVESLNLASVGSGFPSTQLTDFSIQKQRVYDCISELVLACQAVAAPLGDEWSEARGDSLEDRIANVRQVSRELETATSQVYFSLQLILEMVPSPDTAAVKAPEPEDGYNQGRSRSVSNAERPLPAQAGRPRPNADPAYQNYLNGEPEKVRKVFGEVPAPPPMSAPMAEDIPSYLRLDHEGELAYDSKADPPVLRGGTLAALVEQLTRHDRLDSSFNNTFLLTYKSFTTAAELFEMLVQRWKMQPSYSLSAEDYQTWVDKKQKPTRFRVMNILKSWFETYWMEGNDEDAQQIIQRVYTFAKEHVATTNTTTATSLIQAVEQRARGQDIPNKRLVLTLNTQTPQPVLPKNMKKLKFLDIDETEFARQLTIIESRLYCKIKPTECLNKTWQKKLNPGEPEPAKNVKELILHSNQLTNWVAQMILAQPAVKNRVVVIKRFVTVADRCRQLNNFSTLTSIISALSTAPIHRLTRTWNGVNAKTMHTLEQMRKLMGSTKNFNEYRETLAKSNPPCIPFFGVYLTDLTFIEDGIPSIIKKTDLINFAKRAKTAEVIRGIQQYQNVPYPLQPVTELQDYILNNMRSAGDVHEMYEMSLQVEPREREDEKIARLLSESGFL